MRNPTPASAVSCGIKVQEETAKLRTTKHVLFLVIRTGGGEYVCIYRCKPFCCEYPYKQLDHQLHTFRIEYMLLWVQFVRVCCPRWRAVKLVCCNCCRLSEFLMKRFDQLMSMWVSLKEHTNKNLTVYSLFVMIKRIILHIVWERKLTQRKSWKDSEITGHTASATVVMKHVFTVKFNGMKGCGHHLLRPEEMKKTTQTLTVWDSGQAPSEARIKLNFMRTPIHYFRQGCIWVQNFHSGELPLCFTVGGYNMADDWVIIQMFSCDNW